MWKRCPALLECQSQVTFIKFSIDDEPHFWTDDSEMPPPKMHYTTFWRKIARRIMDKMIGTHSLRSTEISVDAS